MPYLKNIWYPLAWSDDIPPGSLFSRTVAEVPIVLYRKQEGALAALHDRCPHRFLPLHRGQLLGDAVRCGYHGLTFDAAGQCIHNPQGQIPAGAKVASYPVTEIGKLVWVWLGAAHPADVSEIPDYSFLTDAPETALATGYLPNAGNYQLITDNIMDLSHVDFLHGTTLGGSGISQSRPKVEQVGNCVVIQWQGLRQNPPPIYAPFLPTPDALVDQFMEVRWYPPGVMILTNSMTPSGYDDSHSIISTNIHLAVPETERTAHYLWAGTRNFLLDDADMNQRRAEAIRQVFLTEDKPTLEAVQLSMGDATDVVAMKPLVLPSDMGALRARKILAKLLAAEQAGEAARPG